MAWCAANRTSTSRSALMSVSDVLFRILKRIGILQILHLRGKYVDGWLAAGCKNVWFEMGRGDINGRRQALSLILELPTDKQSRTKVYDLIKTYNTEMKVGSGNPQDSGTIYEPVEIH